jgi:glyoxylase-like metal-dependent hydrolase (beta-lactamase superfamily II)
MAATCGRSIMAEKVLASKRDLSDKTASFIGVEPDLSAYTAEGGPNSGIAVYDDDCIIIDAQATPIMAENVIARVRTATDKPIRYVVLSHYHPGRIPGVSAYNAQGIIASSATHDPWQQSSGDLDC